MGANSRAGCHLEKNAWSAFLLGAQLMLAKATEVPRTHMLIAGVSLVSTANQQQQLQGGIEWEVKRLQVVQSTKDEAEWLDLDTKKLNPTGLDQL